ncbi:hypothetical protein U9M48_019685, partial [Paspalum notatum var. saurae]
TRSRPREICLESSIPHTTARACLCASPPLRQPTSPPPTHHATATPPRRHAALPHLATALPPPHRTVAEPPVPPPRAAAEHPPVAVPAPPQSLPSPRDRGSVHPAPPARRLPPLLQAAPPATPASSEGRAAGCLRPLQPGAPAAPLHAGPAPPPCTLHAQPLLPAPSMPGALPCALLHGEQLQQQRQSLLLVPAQGPSPFLLLFPTCAFSRGSSSRLMAGPASLARRPAPPCFLPLPHQAAPQPLCIFPHIDDQQLLLPLSVSPISVLHKLVETKSALFKIF